MARGYRRSQREPCRSGFPRRQVATTLARVRLPSPSRPRPRTTLASAAAVLVGVVGGWVAGLLRAPRAPR